MPTLKKNEFQSEHCRAHKSRCQWFHLLGMRWRLKKKSEDSSFNLFSSNHYRRPVPTRKNRSESNWIETCNQKEKSLEIHNSKSLNARSSNPKKIRPLRGRRTGLKREIKLTEDTSMKKSQNSSLSFIDSSTQHRAIRTCSETSDRASKGFRKSSMMLTMLQQKSP